MAGKKSDTQPSFEKALEELEGLVEGMESESLPLEELIVGYEKGMKLHQICEKRLEEAEAKVKLIRKKGSEGAVDMVDFDSGSDGPEAKASDNGDDELF